MARELNITKEDFDKLPQAVKDALLYNRPIVVIDIVQMEMNPEVCMTFQGQFFNLLRPCRELRCPLYLKAIGGNHFHSTPKGDFILTGEIECNNVKVIPVPKPSIVSS